MIKEVVYLAVTDLHETYHLSMWCWKKPALKIILQFISNLREKYMTTFPKGRFLWYSGDKLRINKASIVVNSHFSRRPDGCWECCHNFALLNHLYHICSWGFKTKLKLLDALNKSRTFNFDLSYFWNPFR